MQIIFNFFLILKLKSACRIVVPHKHRVDWDIACAYWIVVVDWELYGAVVAVAVAVAVAVDDSWNHRMNG